MRPKGENWGSQSQFSLLYSFVMIYHCRQDIIRQLVRAFDADAHGVFILNKVKHEHRACGAVRPADYGTTSCSLSYSVLDCLRMM